VSLTLAVVPRRWWPVLLAIGVTCGFVFRGEPGRLPPDRAFGRAAAAMANAQKTVFFVADFPEMDGAFLAVAKLDLLVARKEFDDLRANPHLRGFEQQPDVIAGWLAGVILKGVRDRGAQLVVTDRAVQWLIARLPAFGAAWEAFGKQAGAVRLPAEAGIAGVVVR